MRITLSGIDEKTRLYRLVDKIPKEQRHKVEFAILLSANPEGRNRYPSLAWIEDTLNLHEDINFAVHLCGSTARKNALEGKYYFLDDNGEDVKRIQVNGKVSLEELEQFTKMFYQQIITQHVPYNAGLNVVNEEIGNGNHALLVDASGGKGISPTEWIAPETNKFVGFAGGLGPHNLETELLRIKQVSKPGVWVDMESSLRDENDWFDIDKALKCIELVVEA
jgi:hypothetical protein